jgi:hypothetical protein
VITPAEAVAASSLAFLAAAMLSAYLADAVGLTIRPLAALLVAAAAGIGAFAALRRHTASDRPQLATFAAVGASVLAWLSWIARPAMLPIGGGPDLTHHLLLVEYIERHWRLPRDPQLGSFLGEMVAYTPGMHLLAALAGAWTGSDGFHAIYPLVAAAVALKCGIVFLIAYRLLDAMPPRIPLALTAVALLLLPRAYVFGSFAEHSFLAQTVSELFALGCWGALIVWADEPSAAAMTAVGLFAAAVFLTWPVWIGALLLVILTSVLRQERRTSGDRMRDCAIAVAPVAVVAGIHAARALQSMTIVRTAGDVLWPSLPVFGVTFLTLAAAGIVVSSTSRRTRTILWLLAALGLESAALYAIALDTASPYLALKIVYLAIYPLAIAGALALGACVKALDARSTRLFGVQSPQRRSSPRVLSVALALVIGLLGARSAATLPRPKPIVSQTLYDAGTWARANVPPACVDYLVSDGYTAYWLHLAMLGNARSAARSIDNDTYEPSKAIERWILPVGLPYAIAEDLSALPKDIRDSVDSVARFGPTAVIRRRGPAACAR